MKSFAVASRATSSLAILALSSALGCSAESPALSITNASEAAPEGEVAQRTTSTKVSGDRGKVAGDNGNKATKRKATKRTKRAKGAAQPVGDAPPIRSEANVPGARVRSSAGPGGVHMQMDVEDETGSHSATVSVKAGNLPGMGIQMQVNEQVQVRERVVVQERAAPPPAQRRRARTCKAAVLANGHSSASLIHCDDDVNDRCAVALLNAGHSPAALVHCSDVEDVGCAVQLLKSGRGPAEIVHCN